jgi:hypothetical protein
MRFVRATCPYAALVALTVITYLPVWNNDFVDFDDPVYITGNPQVTNGFSWLGFCWAWTVDQTSFRIPITWFSLQLDAQFFTVRTPDGQTRVSPAAVHGHNLLLHTANVLLLFGFWQRITGRRWPSFLVAALFAVHPMHVESVAWAAERKDVLSVFFGLLALWFYIRYLEKPGWPRYVPLIAAYLLSLLAKPMLLTFPFVLLLLDYWPLCRVASGEWREASKEKATRHSPLGTGHSSWGRLILEKVPLFLVAAVMSGITLEAHEARGSMVSFYTISFSARIANALTAYGWYLRSTFFPVRLAILYPHPHERWPMVPALTGGALLLLLTLLCWWQARRRPWLIVGWLWFVGTLLLVIGFVQAGRQSWADRFCYWPHIGLFVALVWGLAELFERGRIPVLIGRLAGAIVLGWLAMLSWNQIGYWRDTPTVWKHALDVTGDNSHAHEHLAAYYHYQGQRTEARYHGNEAHRIQRQQMNDSQP